MGHGRGRGSGPRRAPVLVESWRLQIRDPAPSPGLGARLIQAGTGHVHFAHGEEIRRQRRTGVAPVCKNGKTVRQMPVRGGRGTNIDGKKMENTGSTYSCPQFSCLKFLAQYITTNTAA